MACGRMHDCRSSRTRSGGAWRLWRSRAALAGETLAQTLPQCSRSRLSLIRLRMERRSTTQRRAAWCSEVLLIERE